MIYHPDASKELNISADTCIFMSCKYCEFDKDKCIYNCTAEAATQMCVFGTITTSTDKFDSIASARCKLFEKMPTYAIFFKKSVQTTGVYGVPTEIRAQISGSFGTKEEAESKIADWGLVSVVAEEIN